MSTFNHKIRLVYFILYCTLVTFTVHGQQRSNNATELEALKIDTHAVSFSALVLDKQTRQPVPELRREEFRLFVDGQERAIDYFGFDGQARRPLRLILYFNLAPEGALRYLSQATTQKSLLTALSALGGKDEVMVVAAYDWFVGKPEVLTELTHDWSRVAASIAAAANAAPAAQQTDKTQKRSMNDAVELAAQVAATTNSEAEVALVYISDGVNSLDTMEFRDRKEIAAKLLKQNLSFSAVNFKMLRSYSAAAAVINPLAFAFGASVTGSANYLAEQSGGLKADVEQAENFGAALAQVIQAYGSRYSFGIELDPKELDGRVHKVELKINPGSQHKGRKLTINVKRGFYAAPLPK